jgi:hypothetical protein
VIPAGQNPSGEAPIPVPSGHYLQSQLYQVSGHAPAIFLLASAALILSAFVASESR